MAKKKHVCRPTSCPCACAVKPKRRKTRTVPSNLPPRQSPIEALVALMGTRLLNPEPQIKQQQSQGQTLIQKKSVETQAEPTRVSMETQYETPARLRPPVPPARLPPPLPPPRQTLALPSAMPPSRLFPPGYGAGYETPAPPPARLPPPGYGEQYGRVFDAEILKGKTREQIKKLPPVLLTEQVKSARERSAMAKEDKGSLGARKVYKLKKTKPKEVEVMPVIMEDQMEELAKSLEAEGGGRPLSISRPSDSNPSSMVQSATQSPRSEAPRSFHSRALEFLEDV